MDSHPDYLVVQAGSNDVARGTVQDSIKVADTLVELTRQLCTKSGALGGVVCAMTQRYLGTYLVSQSEVDEYNLKIKTANAFLKTMLEHEPHLHFWKHKGITSQAAHLVCWDGTHMNPAGQFKLYKSIRGALTFAAKQCGVHVHELAN